MTKPKEDMDFFNAISSVNRVGFCPSLFLRTFYEHTFLKYNHTIILPIFIVSEIFNYAILVG